MDASARGHDPSSRCSNGIYGVIEKPDFVLIVPVENDGRLIPRRAVSLPREGPLLGTSPGLLGTGPETDPLEIARGELREETGLDAAEMTYVGHLFEACGYSDQGFHIFLATGLRHGDPFVR
jgi:ADP-ribose pyrophosphatase